MDPTYFKSAETGAMLGTQEEQQWQIWDVTRVGREEKQINTGAEERDWPVEKDPPASLTTCDED